MFPVRPAVPDDAAEVVRLGALMFEEMGLAPTGPWRAQAEDVAARGLANRTVVAFVIDHPDQAGRLIANAAGTIAQRLPGPLNPAGRAGYIQYVCTEPGFRGQGLGRAVMEALLGWYESEGVGAVELHATADGEPLYRAMGFEEGDNPALRRRLGPGPGSPDGGRSSR